MSSQTDKYSTQYPSREHESMRPGSALSLALDAVAHAKKVISEKGTLHGNPNSDMAARYFSKSVSIQVRPKLAFPPLNQNLTYPLPMSGNENTTSVYPSVGLGVSEEKKT